MIERDWNWYAWEKINEIQMKMIEILTKSEVQEEQSTLKLNNKLPKI